MLVTFPCKAYADITMFGDVALGMLKMMGHSKTVPGAILAEDVPAALDRLKRAVEAGEAAPTQSEARERANDEANEPPVSQAHRALPLIELLATAAKAKCDVEMTKETGRRKATTWRCVSPNWCADKSSLLATAVAHSLSCQSGG